ncbi:MAG: hypothetical protein WEA29_04775, partial [Acidimicrobiia bacterium]
MWNWFGAAFGIIVLLGGSILYIGGRSGPAVDEAPAAESPAPVAPAPEAAGTDHDAAEDSPAAVGGSTSAVLLGMYVVDSFGF